MRPVMGKGLSCDQDANPFLGVVVDAVVAHGHCPTRVGPGVEFRVWGSDFRGLGFGIRV